PLLLARGDEVTSVDIAPPPALPQGAAFRRGDVRIFDEVMAAVAEARPDRVVNLAYFIGSDEPPHQAFRLNVQGMENVFEASRLGGVPHVLYASSLAVSGLQSHFGERPVTEDDPRHGTLQYAMHKIFNEFQAKDYREKHGLTITGIRPANVTGPDKLFGSVDHVHCITAPARGQSVTFPYRDAMRCPVHVDDVAEVFARVTVAEKPKHAIYATGGHTISLGDLADMVRGFLPEADIRFEHTTGGREKSGNYLIDNRRLVEEFGVQYAPYRARVLQIINAVRAETGKPPLVGV
ncbi:MAG: NAD(P)-dependent oxidoreductase, partial [Acetobacteraceae bacterium]|nr:NAD(P)-dependent oxidoreductase [Acetobacteraceae bacterium]